MSLSLVFDTLLALLLLTAAWRSLATPNVGHALIAFVIFGLLMALAWVRLDAPDFALAEAAIGAGLSGVLLFDAWRELRKSPAPERGVQ